MLVAFGMPSVEHRSPVHAHTQSSLEGSSEDFRAGILAAAEVLQAKGDVLLYGTEQQGERLLLLRRQQQQQGRCILEQ